MTSLDGTRQFCRRERTRPRPGSAVPPATTPPERQAVMTSRIGPAEVLIAQAHGRDTLPWVPTMSRRQRHLLAARIAQPSSTYDLADARA